MMRLFGSQKFNRTLERFDARGNVLGGGDQFRGLMSPFLQDADEILQHLSRARVLDQPGPSFLGDGAEFARRIADRLQVAVLFAALRGVSGSGRGREEPRGGLGPE